MEAYEQFKSRYPAGVLFFRLGEDYAAFFDDAKLVSSAFDLPLEYGGPCRDIPVISLDECLFKVNLNKLLRDGFEVVVVEQIGARDIIKTFSPGKTKAG